MRIYDFTGGPETVAAAVTALARAAPAALPFAAGPGRAERMGLRVSDEVAGIALGVLDADEQAAHVPAWMLAQRGAVGARRTHGQTSEAAGVTDRVPVVLFAEGTGPSGGADETGLIVQWAVVTVVRGARN